MHLGERTYLHTLGHPVLRRGDGTVVEGLRRKDLALLAYLCVEGDRPFSRAHLAALLWGESAEDRARHSLTQALRRASASVGRGALAMERDTVRWSGAAACDAQLLLESDPRLDELLSIYEGPFLEGFEAGFGSDEFSAWADARRAELRRAAVRWLDRAGERAEREKDWERAQRIGERTVQIDRVWEGGHRRVMRALLERGERNLALRHYREFARWLAYEVGGHPDPETTALADLIRASATRPVATPAPYRSQPLEGIAEAQTDRVEPVPVTEMNTPSDPVSPPSQWGAEDPTRDVDAPLETSASPATPTEIPRNNTPIPPESSSQWTEPHSPHAADEPKTTRDLRASQEASEESGEPEVTEESEVPGELKMAEPLDVSRQPQASREPGETSGAEDAQDSRAASKSLEDAGDSETSKESEATGGLEAVGDAEDSREAEALGGAHDAPGSRERRAGGNVPRRLFTAAAVLLVVLAALWLARLRSASARGAHAAVARGEVIRARGGRTAYLVFGDTLYAFPDAATLERCLGGYPRVRTVRALPPRPRRMLPSVRAHPWLGGQGAVTADDPGPITQYVAVGCVLSPIPDALTFREIFGHTDWPSSARDADTLLQHMPRIHQADPFPLRPAGTLIQGAGDSIRWVAYHGGALSVHGDAVLATYCRTRREVQRVPDAEFRYYQSRAELPPAAVPCRRKPRRAADVPARGSGTPRSARRIATPHLTQRPAPGWRRPTADPPPPGTG